MAVKSDNLDFNRGVSFVVFFKDLNDEPVKTIENILCGMAGVPEIEFEIVLVRDGGHRNILVESFLSEFNSSGTIKFLEINETCGVSKVLDKAVELAAFSHIAIAPGNNPFTVESYTAVVQNFELFDAVLGYRKNLAKARPYPKVIASRCLLLLVKFIFRPRFDLVKDLHGLNLYRTEHVARLARFGHGHGIQISLIVPVSFSGGAISQVQVSNNLMRNSLRIKVLKFPSFKQVLNVFRDLIRLRRTYS